MALQRSSHTHGAPPTSDRRTSPTRAVVAGSFGNVMEQYDNLVYGYSAVTIGQLFFPTSSELAGILYSFAVFGVGFLIRPLGAMAFGHYGDRVGRRAALVVGVTMMGLATFAVGLLPTYASIGVLAPVLLVLMRVIQGFSVAGEWAGSAALLVEYAPARRRGLFGSFNQVSTALGFLLAAAVVAGNNALFTTEQIQAGAWRIPFLLGAATAMAALWLRLGLNETPAFTEEKHRGTTVSNPLVSSVRRELPAMARGFGFTVLWTVAYFFFLTYLPTYLSTVAGVDADVARTSNLVALTLFTGLIVVFGWLSDRIGRKPLLLASAAGFLLLSWPVMMLFSTGSTPAVYLGQLLIVLLLAMFSGPGPAALSELFPTNLRYSGMSVGYNFSVMAFGGTAPFLAAALAGMTGTQSAPFLLPIGAAAITLVVLLSMRETAHRELR
jgi:MHS family proline/betaine transporter-like MFS transporter